MPCASPHASELGRTPSLPCNGNVQTGGCHWPGLILVWVLVLSIAAHAAEPNEAEIDQGREIYGELCVACHGRDMINLGGLSSDLRKFPKDQFDRFRDAVLNGKPPAMPPWRDKITDEDIKLLWAYVRGDG
jgi:mono/diheme cytochrome c family protein